MSSRIDGGRENKESDAQTPRANRRSPVACTERGCARRGSDDASRAKRNIGSSWPARCKRAYCCREFQPIQRVPRGNLRCGCGKARQRHPPLAPSRHVPQRLANLPQCPEVMVPLQSQLLEASAFLRSHPPHLGMALTTTSPRAHHLRHWVTLIRPRGGNIQPG